MAAKKQAVEIKCSECNTRFRLWVPDETIAEWGPSGSQISCIRCGEQYLVRKTAAGLVAEVQLHEHREVKVPDIERVMERKTAAAPVAERPAAPRPVEKRPVTPPPPPQKPAQTRQPQAEVPAPRPRTAEKAPDIVLLIEDDRLSREMVENVLTDMGIRLLSARNGAEALKVLRKEKVRLIVTDLYLKNPADPESHLDGEELLKRIIDSGMNIPSIVTTGKDIIDDLVLDPKWFDLHVKGFIQKGNPFWAEDLKVKIKEVIYKS